MFTEILTNPTIIGSIIGAIVGAIASATFALIISWYKFNKRKNGANALIKSEINHQDKNYSINGFQNNKFSD